MIPIYQNADSVRPSVRNHLAEVSMKSKYCFVRNLAGFTREDVVFIVRVGTDRVSMARLALVSLYAADCGFYFRKWSGEVDTAIDNLARSLFPKSMLQLLYLKQAEVDVNELYRMIIDDTLISYERRVTVPRTLRNLLAKLDPSAYFNLNRPQGAASLQAVPRKNLKSAKQDDFTSFLVGSGLILILVAVDMIVSILWLSV